MKIYDEALKNEITEPDLEKGKLVDAKRLVAHHEEQQRVIHLEIMEGTDVFGGLRHEVEDTPYKAAWDEYEDVQKYVPYTKAELDKIAADKKAEEERKAAEEQAAKEAAEAAQKEAEAKAQAEKEQAEKIARIDAIDAQVTYTAMMTDTLMVEETTESPDSTSSEEK